MTSKDRRPGGVSLQRGTDEVGQPSVWLVTPVVCYTGSRAHHQLVKSGHAFIRAADDVFVPGSPSRFTCPERI